MKTQESVKFYMLILVNFEKGKYCMNWILLQFLEIQLFFKSVGKVFTEFYKLWVVSNSY